MSKSKDDVPKTDVMPELFSALLKSWKNKDENKRVKAVAAMDTRKLSMCINFLGIDGQNDVVMTVTIMKNKVKQSSQDQVNFAKTMSRIELWLREAAEICDEDEEPYGEPYFVPMATNLYEWFRAFYCHRIFFIPLGSVWRTVQHLFTNNHFDTLFERGLYEVSVNINTPEIQGFFYKMKPYDEDNKEDNS